MWPGCPRRRPIAADRAHRRITLDRGHHQPADEGGAVKRLRHPIIGMRIGNDHSLALQHGPTADAGPEWKSPPLPKRRDRVFLGVAALALCAHDKASTLRIQAGTHRSTDRGLQVGQCWGLEQAGHGLQQGLHGSQAGGLIGRRHLRWHQPSWTGSDGFQSHLPARWLRPCSNAAELSSP